MSRLQKILAVAIVVLITLGVVGWWQRDRLIALVFEPRQTYSESERAVSQDTIAVAAESLDTPWDVALLPDGDILVTERSGQLVRIGDDQRRVTVEGVLETSEGGLMGLALHPDFASNRYVYLAVTTEKDGQPINQIRRYVLDDDAVTNRTIILDDIPAAQVHDGGRIAFGPDGKLYITTGDAGQPELAQDTSSLAGKILRVNDDGSLPEGNPFGNAVWSYGHRNPQGIAWDSRERLWSTEHGPSGADTGNDELNLIEKGENYGWPVIVGNETNDGMRTPVLESGKEDTWAPAGLSASGDTLLFTGLRGQTLYVVPVDQSGAAGSLATYLTREYGRLRAVAVYGESLYVGTSNRDGRGQPAGNDDRIFEIPLRSILDN